MSKPTDDSDTIVVVHRAGSANLTDGSARAVLTNEQAALALNPPASLLDGEGELVAVIAQRSASAIESIEHILVQKVVRFDAGGEVIAALFFLRSASSMIATPLGDHAADQQFLDMLQNNPQEAGNHLVRAFDSAQPRGGQPDSDIVEQLDRDRRPEVERIDLLTDPLDDIKQAINWCTIFNCG
jgi:hypothetical protein